MTKHKRECLRLCEQAGLEVSDIEYRSRHLAFHTSKGMLIFPCSPSDHRWHMNMRAQARRLARG